MTDAVRLADRRCADRRCCKLSWTKSGRGKLRFIVLSICYSIQLYNRSKRTFNTSIDRNVYIEHNLGQEIELITTCVLENNMESCKRWRSCGLYQRSFYLLSIHLYWTRFQIRHNQIQRSWEPNFHGIFFREICQLKINIAVVIGRLRLNLGPI